MTDNGSCFISREPLTKPAISLASNTSKPSPTRPNQRQGRSASIHTSLREWAYARAMTAQTNAQQSCLDGFIATIGTDLMAASAPSRPSAASP